MRCCCLCGPLNPSGIQTSWVDRLGLARLKRRRVGAVDRVGHLCSAATDRREEKKNSLQRVCACWPRAPETPRGGRPGTYRHVQRQGKTVKVQGKSVKVQEKSVKGSGISIGIVVGRHRMKEFWGFLQWSGQPAQTAAPQRKAGFPALEQCLCSQQLCAEFADVNDEPSRRQWKRRGRGNVLATKAVETQGRGSVSRSQTQDISYTRQTDTGWRRRRLGGGLLVPLGLARLKRRHAHAGAVDMAHREGTRQGSWW